MSQTKLDAAVPPWAPPIFLFLTVFGLWMLWSGHFSLPPAHPEPTDGPGTHTAGGTEHDGSASTHGNPAGDTGSAEHASGGEASGSHASDEHGSESHPSDGHGDLWKLILGLGLFSCIGVVLLCHRLGIVDEELIPLHLTLPTLGYVPWLAVQVVKSNVDVIRRVLLGGPRISPTVVQVKASQRTDLGRMTYANSITLTPGTLTLDAEKDTLTVHALSARGAKELGKGEMDRRIARLEGAES